MSKRECLLSYFNQSADAANDIEDGAAGITGGVFYGVRADGGAHKPGLELGEMVQPRLKRLGEGSRKKE